MKVNILKRMLRRSLHIILLCMMTVSCKPMICPAFQSSFILDDSVRQAMFSPFNPDSIPKPVNGHLVDKKQWGIVVTMSTAEKESSFRTVDMKTVFPPEAPTDSIQTTATNPNAIPLSPQDSLVNN